MEPRTRSTGNLQGTTRTLDGARGAEHLKEAIGEGLISRDGWALVDDAGRYLIPLISLQPRRRHKPAVGVATASGTRQDLYFFGYGHDYSGLWATMYASPGASRCRHAMLSELVVTLLGVQ